MNHDKVKALVNFWAFLDLIRFKGGTANFDPVHREVARFLSMPQANPEKVDFDPLKFRKRFLMMHRSGFKSTMVVGYILWRIYRNPDIRILINSAEKKLSVAFLREINQYLIDGWLQENVWNDRPHIEGPLVPIVPAELKATAKSDRDMFASLIAQKTVWHAEAIQVIRPSMLKEPTIQVTSARVSDTGFHFDLIINDDLVTFQNSDNIDKARKIYTQAADLVSVLDPMAWVNIATLNGKPFGEFIGREIIVTGTPYFYWDYNVHLQNSDDLGFAKFVRNIYANGVDSTDGYTCPSRFNDEYAKELRQQLVNSRGVKAWTAQYLLKVTSSESQALSHEGITRIAMHNITPMPNGVVEVNIGGDKKVLRCIAALDPAATVEKYSNWSGFVIGGVDDKNNLYIVGGFKDKHTPSALAERCLRILQFYQVWKLVIEAGVGLSAAVIDTFRLVFQDKLPCLFVPYTPTGDKVDRINWALEPYLGKDRVASMFVCDVLYDALVDEIQLFDPEASSNSDDLLDSIQILINSLVKSRGVRRRQMFEQAMPVNTKYGGFL